MTLRGRETVSLTLQPGDTVPELKQQIHIAGGGFPPAEQNLWFGEALLESTLTTITPAKISTIPATRGQVLVPEIVEVTDRLLSDYGIADGASLQLLPHGWSAGVLPRGQYFYADAAPDTHVLWSPPREPPPLYDGDAARWPVHAAASADDLTRLQALLGPADDFDPDRKQDGLELVPVRKEREGRIALVEQRDDSGRT